MSNFPTTVKFTTSEVVQAHVVEHVKHCTFVGDFCLKGRHGDFVEQTAAIFWQETPPVEGYSNYFGLIVQGGQLLITSGASAFDAPIEAIVTPAGEVVYSRHRWDCRSAETATFQVDGGRDYLRVIGDTAGCRKAILKVDGPNITIEYQDEQ